MIRGYFLLSSDQHLTPSTLQPSVGLQYRADGMAEGVPADVLVDADFACNRIDDDELKPLN
ncbi:MAG: hypothetical protein ABI147_11155 [Acidobacteriaceae bacterium]